MPEITVNDPTLLHHLSWVLLLLCLLSGVLSSAWIARRAHRSAHIKQLSIVRFLMLASMNDIFSCILYFGYFARIYSKIMQTAVPYWLCSLSSAGVFYTATATKLHILLLTVDRISALKWPIQFHHRRHSRYFNYMFVLIAIASISPSVVFVAEHVVYGTPVVAVCDGPAAHPTLLLTLLVIYVGIDVLTMVAFVWFFNIYRSFCAAYVGTFNYRRNENRQSKIVLHTVAVHIVHVILPFIGGFLIVRNMHNMSAHTFTAMSLVNASIAVIGLTTNAVVLYRRMLTHSD